MSIFTQALSWLADPAHWSGTNGVPTRLGQHIAITLAAVLLAALIAWPIGLLVGHWRRGDVVVGLMTGAGRAVPTLGLVTLGGLWLGIGLTAPLLALVVLAIPSLLAGTAAGIRAVDPRVVDAAKAQGMTATQVIARVELPLAGPVIMGGLRVAVLQSVATATLAAYIADFGLGRYLFIGLKSRNYPVMMAGALLVTALALVFDLGLAALQRRVDRAAHPSAVRR